MEKGGVLTIQTQCDASAEARSKQPPSGTEASNIRTVQIRVQDTGAGISPEIVPHLFDPFFTTKHKGTGLGLAICREVIEEHGRHY